jgi:hypothetical protein
VAKQLEPPEALLARLKIPIANEIPPHFKPVTDPVSLLDASEVASIHSTLGKVALVSMKDNHLQWWREYRKIRSTEDRFG